MAWVETAKTVYMFFTTVTHHLNLEEKTQETSDSCNDVSNVSTLIVSERKYSGTESVQINEKLIQREN